MAFFISSKPNTVPKSLLPASTALWLYELADITISTTLMACHQCGDLMQDLATKRRKGMGQSASTGLHYLSYSHKLSFFQSD
jgi:hypothetical protein